MSKEKQIEEMARLMCEGCADYGDCKYDICDATLDEAERLYNAGYRKQSEGEWEAVNDMTDRERLIELVSIAVGDCNLTDAEIKIVADYLLANGVIVPPCKVGDTVYRIVEMGTGIHYKQVGRFEIGYTRGYKIVPCTEKIKRFIRSCAVTKNNFFDVCENIGKTVFLTKEEAEAKLRELRK